MAGFQAKVDRQSSPHRRWRGDPIATAGRVNLSVIASQLPIFDHGLMLSHLRKFFRPVSFGYLLLLGVLGLSCTVAVAWSCVLWSPATWNYHPADYYDTAPIKTDVTGRAGLFYEVGGPGWRYMSYVGWRQDDGYIMWRDCCREIPDHYESGWPLKALRSQIASNSFGERRWELPWPEILSRGPSSKEFSAWMHVKEDRRVSLIPIPLGLIANTAIYAAAVHILIWVGGRILRKYFRLRIRPAFEVIVEPQIK